MIFCVDGPAPNTRNGADAPVTFWSAAHSRRYSRSAAQGRPWQSRPVHLTTEQPRPSFAVV